MKFLTNNEIDKAFNQPSKSGFGKSRYDIAKEIQLAFLEKLQHIEKPPFRWLVTYYEASSEFAGKRSTNVYESTPVLQYWNGYEYVDVPVERILR